MKKLVSYGSISFALAMLFAMTASAALAPNPPVVNLGTAGNFVILSKAGITDVPTSDITGNIGASPINGASIGVTCPEVTGIIFAVDATGPACFVPAALLLTTAVGDMETAYNDAAARAPSSAATTNVGTGTPGTLAGLTLTRGVYQWGSAVTITTDLTLNGAANDVWIFQVAGTLDMAEGMSVILTGGAQAKNVFWAVTGAVTLGPGSDFAGTILAQTNIAMQTAATLNGRALAQTAVTLDQNTVTIPAFVPAKGPGPKPIKVAPIHVVGAPDTGTCNNTWALDTFDKVYTITAEFGAYNVNVVYNKGTFVTVRGVSPGSCEGSVSPGTVAAGIKGKMKQEYNGTVIGTLSGAKCSPTACFDTTSILHTLFNTGWFFIIQPDGQNFTWINSYDAGPHGKWFDTSTNWPLNDTGDIN